MEATAVVSEMQVSGGGRWRPREPRGRRESVRLVATDSAGRNAAGRRHQARRRLQLLHSRHPPASVNLSTTY